MLATSSTLIFNVQDPASRDQKLEEATALLSAKATGCGVVVTRVDFAMFTVALSSDVPYGLTREIDLL